MRRRFILHSAQKFWEIRVSGSSLEICWGKIGKPGQSKTKNFVTLSEAERHASKLVSGKQMEGYIEEGQSSENEPEIGDSEDSQNEETACEYRHYLSYSLTVEFGFENAFEELEQVKQKLLSSGLFCDIKGGLFGTRTHLHMKAEYTGEDMAKSKKRIDKEFKKLIQTIPNARGSCSGWTSTPVGWKEKPDEKAEATQQIDACVSEKESFDSMGPRIFRYEPDADIRGVSICNEFELSPRLIVQRFGKPGKGDGSKISGQYIFVDQANNPFVVHDWKSTNFFEDDFPDPDTLWNSDTPEELCISAAGSGGEEFMRWFLEQLSSID